MASLTHTSTARRSTLAARIDLIERRISDALRDLRRVRSELDRAELEKGVLGSRGFTQFILEYLSLHRETSHSIRHLLSQAECAGYAPPASRTLTKRLSEHAARTGKITYSRDDRGWRWLGDKVG